MKGERLPVHRPKAKSPTAEENAARAAAEAAAAAGGEDGEMPTHANGLALHLAPGTATGYRGVEMKRDKRGLPTGRYKARVWEAGAARTRVETPTEGGRGPIAA